MISFQESIEHIKFPEKFTFPFAYDPHPLAQLASKEAQAKLPLNENELGGKMYGVLVVQNTQNELGYLVAFSGQEAEVISSISFVPPIYNRLAKDDFFKQGEAAIFQKKEEIESIENSTAYVSLLSALEKAVANSEIEILAKKEANKLAKAKRGKRREVAKKEQDTNTLKILDNDSIRDHYNLKRLKISWKERITSLKTKIEGFEVDKLKKERKRLSVAMQEKLFDQYQFLNYNGLSKTLLDLFPERPPAGAGDCAAPKLLQYAFKHQLTPVVMAEFWWGKSPKAELRKHLHYYPACGGKCRPILTYMLEGIPMDEDPAIAYSSENHVIDILFEDEHISIIHKPEGLLSVPAKHNRDSVQTRMKKRYCNATGPLIAHRLDKHTSGLMIIVKSDEVYKNIQNQFIERTIHKEYTAVVEGSLNEKGGTISLPLTVDHNNRPRQKVCYEHGKTATTHWKVLSEDKDQTKIRFTPVTGRTHQLRVHAAHPAGLNAPIIGDQLYGNKSERLLLHAAFISFRHPMTGKEMSFTSPAQF